MISLQQLKNLNINYLYVSGDMFMENNSFNQSINGNNNAASINMAGGNITSNVNVSGESIKDITNIIEELRKLLNQEQLDGLEKENTIDDLDTIQEQIKSNQPKKVRLTSALERIRQFADKIPATVAAGKLIIGNIHTLYDKLQPIIDNIIH